MLSTVTTAVSTIVSSYGNVVVSLGAAGVLTLVASLVIKELATAGGRRGANLSRNMDVVILPLLFVLSFAVFMKVWEILS